MSKGLLPDSSTLTWVLNDRQEMPRLTTNRKRQRALLSLLRQLCLEAGLRQVDMAKKLGKRQASVSYYESGVRRLDLLELRQICGGLALSLVEFVRRFENQLQ
jgi:hypothetical protein